MCTIWEMAAVIRAEEELEQKAAIALRPAKSDGEVAASVRPEPVVVAPL